MNTNHDALREAALNWWKQRRPIDWPTEKHLAHPTVNCSSPAEDALAVVCAALSQPEAAVQGWKLVPVEPTPEMLIRGGEQFFDLAGPNLTNDSEKDQDDAASIYRAMLSASPAAPEGAKKADLNAEYVRGRNDGWDAAMLAARSPRPQPQAHDDAALAAQGRQRRAWMCSIAFDHEIEGDAFGTKVYPSLDALKKAHPMWDGCGVTEVVIQEVSASHAAPEREKPDDSEQELMRALEERDAAEEMADQLAAQIAAITGEEIGEHSSSNDPWRNAMLAADEWIAKDIRRLCRDPDPAQPPHPQPQAQTTPSADDIHSCGEFCDRPDCVAAREAQAQGESNHDHPTR
jgi:hypothetical protein